MLSVLAKRRFHLGDDGIGVLLFGRGMGVLLGPWFVKKASKRGLPAVVTACGVGSIIYGLGYLLVASAPTIQLAAVAGFLAHLGGGAQWSSVVYGIAKTSPDAVRGRIGAADFAIVTLSMSISLIAAGLLSLAIGPRTTIYIIAVVQFSWGMFFLYRTRTVRNIDPATILAQSI
jgi:hypothetical protein